MGLCIWVILFFLAIIALNKIWCFWSKSKVCLVGKTAIITGGAAGIGFETALTLASKGCRIIIADVANTSLAVDEIIKETHNPNIIGKNVDLASFKSVREFAKDILDTEPKLDILICNAGVGEVKHKCTVDGNSRVMQINYFSHFLLTHLLLDLVKKSAPSRIVFTSSSMAYFTADLKSFPLNPPANYPTTYMSKWAGQWYANSKLAIAAFTKTLGKKLEGTGVTVNTTHPFIVKTAIFAKCFKRDLFFPVLLLNAVVYLFGKTPEEGAQTLIELAQSDSVKNITGQSFAEGMRIPRPRQINSNELCQKIWDETVIITKLEPHEIKC